MPALANSGIGGASWTTGYASNSNRHAILISMFRHRWHRGQAAGVVSSPDLWSCFFGDEPVHKTCPYSANGTLQVLHGSMAAMLLVNAAQI